MKKLIAALGLVFVLGGVVQAEDIKRTNSDIITFQTKGSTNIALAVSSHGVVYNTEGLVNVHESFHYIPAPSTTAILNVVVDMAQLTARTTTYPNVANSLARIQYPSPLILNLSFHAGGSTMTHTSTVTISGLDSLGSSRTVTVKVTTSVASSNVAFVSISAITYGVFGTTLSLANNNAVLTIGTTNQIGLANDILSAGDVYEAFENNTFITSTTVSADYNWVQPTIVPNRATTTTVNGGIIDIWYGHTFDYSYRARQSPPRRVRPNRP